MNLISLYTNMENLDLSILSTILIIAALQGFVLAFMLTASKKYRKKSNIALAIAIASTSMVIVGNLFYDTGLVSIVPAIQYFPMHLSYWIPVGIYFFVKFLIGPEETISKTEKLIFVPAILQVIILGSVFITFLIRPSVVQHYQTEYNIYRFADEAFSIILCFILLVISIKMIISYHAKLYDNYTNVDNKRLNWLKTLLLIILFLWLVWTVSFIYANVFNTDYRMYPVWFGMAAINYSMGYFIYLKRDVFEVATFDNIVEPEKHKKENQLSIKTDEHYSRLLSLMQSEMPYNNPDLNMTLLAEKMELSNGYLSQIINAKENKSFYEFINHYRVEDVKAKLADSDFDHYSILGIGLESGFKSKSTFNAVFKKMTGKTPSSYKKTILKK